MVTYTVERVFQCHICEKSFTRAFDLKNHKVTHTGERALQCHICEKSFTQAGSLKKHMVTHTGESVSVSYL